MKLILLIIFLIYLYGSSNKLYLSSTQQENPNKADYNVVEKFFTKYNSPLSENARDFIEASEAYNLPKELLPAISMVESTGGKHTPSCASYNPFGWSSTTSPCGFYRFKDFKEAIWYVSEKIARGKTYSRYQETGRIDELARRYNPGGSEEWIKGVQFFSSKLIWKN